MTWVLVICMINGSCISMPQRFDIEAECHVGMDVANRALNRTGGAMCIAVHVPDLTPQRITP